MKNLLWVFIKKLANLSFSIFLLSIIAFFSFLGSIIEQGQSIKYYQFNYPKSSLYFVHFNWEWISYLGLDHIFQTWWFILTLFIFILSLTSCSFFVQLPSLKNARRWKFFSSNSPGNFNKYFENNFFIYCHSYINIVYSLIRSNFFIFCQDKSIYSYKGLSGRIAPIFVHFSIVIILLGSMLSFLSSFVVQEMIPNGEIFHLKNIIHSGFYSKIPIDLWGRIDNFYINYNIDGSIQQFFSELSIFYKMKNILNEKNISVNSPLHFKGITFYQTDWQIDAARIILSDNMLIQKKLIKASIKSQNCWLCKINLDKNTQIFLLLFNLNNNVVIFNANGNIVAAVQVGQKFYINNIIFCIQEIMSSTGIQIKVDPGILFVYLGFLFLMLSTILSYISYSQIWIHGYRSSFNLIGTTNRAILFFESNIFYLNKLYYYYSSLNYLIARNLIDYILK
uniref:Cytochrome c biogenesis protein Ccs1 n=1 Tax=Ophidocladus simpliciusculus TaxID=1261574 RepID=A0A1Z1MJJ2_9FLOR|nr:cytochrome c biogenesis protein ccs1 [Ophidocladus simpliciusculus]ARW65924.1 cytochrome c biogenesis protein ccs1 [Ophidocladus simpliciusculus]